jgi:hypothetical protein
MTVCMISGLLLWASCGAAVRSAQTESLEKKLGTVTNYVPQAAAPADQLVEVARRFKLPMGIEWVEKADTATPDKTPPSGNRTVRELIEEIVSASPGYLIEVDDGLVRIYSPSDAVHPFNFLNIQLDSYSVKDGHLFEAEDRLRWAIRFTLEPEKYRHGYGGGYGHGTPDVFQIPKFTLSSSDVTIREVLNRIALAQGNALWVATIKQAGLERDEPVWKLKGVDGGVRRVTSAWRFVPLAEIAELAQEQVAVDLTIAGLLDKRITRIPVMLDDGLSGSSGGATSVTSSEGYSYQYGVRIEKIDKDFVTLSVHLTVGHRGEGELKFEEKLQVHKGRITEVRPEPRITIRAYLERAEKP